ncbi:hypothetical protein OAF56_05025 [Pirellulaceae bacterium]|jgi:hypothetical protein|nr:hypothetical protein [Pirellulaceae bacterium]
MEQLAELASFEWHFFLWSLLINKLRISGIRDVPVVVLLLPLILAQFPDAEFGVHKQRGWDLAKDLPNEIRSFHYPIFASYLAMVAAKKLAILQRKTETLPLLQQC